MWMVKPQHSSQAARSASMLQPFSIYCFWKSKNMRTFLTLKVNPIPLQNGPEFASVVN